MDTDEKITRLETAVAAMAESTQKLTDFLSARLTAKELFRHLKPESPFAEPDTSNPPADPGPRFTIRGMADAMQVQPARDWVVKGLLEAGDVALLSAKSGDGKTWIVDELGTAHARGADWQDFEMVQGTTLIINEEMGERDMKTRLAMCNRAKFGDENTPVYFISFARFNLLDPKKADADAGAIETAITETQARLVIIDALADIMAGGNENDVKDTQVVFMRLSDIAKKTGAAILVIHHTGKNGQTRGSSAIPGAVDLVIKMTRAEGSPFVTFETEKARNIKAIKWVAKMVWTEDQFYTERFYPDGKKSPKYSKAEQLIIDYLTEKAEPLTVEDITTFTLTTRNTLNALIHKGVVERADLGGPGKKATYQLKPVPVGNLLEPVS